ncbi:PfkB family carbohydrate kinase [Martelella sp. AMO21009]
MPSGSELARDVRRVKPNLGKVETLVEQKLRDPAPQEQAVRELIGSGAAELITCPLDRDGALLATSEGTLRLDAPRVVAKSPVGAGDSFVAAITLGLAKARDPEAEIAYGMAAGAAAVLSFGTGPFR